MQAAYYRASAGREPGRECIDALDVEVRVALDAQIDRLNTGQDTDPPLPFPHSSQVEGELRELRCHFGRQLYRVLYRRSRNLFVLLHVFRKTGADVPASDERLAQERWDDFERRMNEPQRRPPRAAGHDAP